MPPPVPAPHADIERLRRRMPMVWRRHCFTALMHAWGLLLLTGWCVAGYVSASVVIASALYLGTGVALLTLAYATGWNLRRRDYGLLIAQQALAVVFLLALAIWVPAMAVFAFFALLVTTADSYYAPSVRSLLLLWVPAVLILAATVLLNGGRMTMPTGNTLGRVCAVGLLLAGVGRCIWLVIDFRRLQQRLRRANAELAVLVGRIEELARRDDLTGLANRRAVTEWLAEHKAGQERSGRPFCIAMVDIDHFKQVNDRLGHDAGDFVLQRFGSLAPASLRTNDRIGRYGGEEFLIVLGDTPLDDAIAPLTRLLDSMRAAQWPTLEDALKVTITIGATQFREGESVESLVRRADEALYDGKASGRDCIRVLGWVEQAGSPSTSSG